MNTHYITTNERETRDRKLRNGTGRVFTVAEVAAMSQRGELCVYRGDLFVIDPELPHDVASDVQLLFRLQGLVATNDQQLDRRQAPGSEAFHRSFNDDGIVTYEIIPNGEHTRLCEGDQLTISEIKAMSRSNQLHNLEGSIFIAHPDVADDEARDLQLLLRINGLVLAKPSCQHAINTA